jgi:cell division septation protein DedD
VDAVSSYIPRFSVEALTLPAPHTEAVFADAWPSDADELRFHFRSEQVSDHGVRIVRSPSAPVPAVSAEPITQEESPRAAAVDAFEVVIGAFAQTANADRLASRLEQQGQPARTALRSDGLTLVVWGGYADAAAAEAGLAAAADAGFTGAWVRRIP